MTKEKIAFIFPGQGAQYIGMGKDLSRDFTIAKHVFEEADDLLKHSLSSLMFDGLESDLKQTRNCQPALFVHSYALFKVLKSLYPDLSPDVCAGLSLGEYSALCVSGRLSFADCLLLVQERADAMHVACESSKGTMAVVMGLDGSVVEQMVSELRLPNDLWAANFNCPGQVVVSGTEKGIEVAKEEALKRGARRVLPLQVHGAFHSGLMSSAEERLKNFVTESPLTHSKTQFVMNVPGDFVEDLDQIRRFLVEQVTRPVRWEQSIRAMEAKGISCFFEIGAGRSLSGMNKRIKVKGNTISVDTSEQIKQLEQVAR